MMKAAFMIMTGLLFPALAGAQKLIPVSSLGRKLINGAENRIVISGIQDSVTIRLSVLSGTIVEQTTNTMVYKKNKSLLLTENYYKWSVCTGDAAFEPLIVNSYKNTKLIAIDTLLFDIVDPPAIEANVYKQTGSADPFDRSKYENLTPPAIIGVGFWDSNLYDRFGAFHISDFSVTVIVKNKIKEEFKNQGSLLSAENRAILAKYSSGYILIHDVNAYLDCGLKMKVQSPAPIYYSKTL